MPDDFAAVHDTIQSGLGDLLKLGIDYKKFLGHPQLKVGIEAIAVAAKDSISAPFNIDDMIINQAVAAIEIVLDQYKAINPVPVTPPGGGTVVGAMANPVGKKRSKEEVEAALKSVGIDPMTIASIIMMILRYAPDLIAAIKKLFGK